MKICGRSNCVNEIEPFWMCTDCILKIIDGLKEENKKLRRELNEYKTLYEYKKVIELKEKE